MAKAKKTVETEPVLQNDELVNEKLNTDEVNDPVSETPENTPLIYRVSK